MDFEKILRYDSETGKFFWKIRTSPRKGPGEEAGGEWNGYVRITIKKKPFLAHRLAWFMTFGTWPIQIDHINGKRDDNRLRNLREANAMLNAKNKLCHRNGKEWGAHFVRGKWQSSLRIEGRNVYVGFFDSEAEAHAAAFGYVKGAGLLKHFGLEDK